MLQKKIKFNRNFAGRGTATFILTILVCLVGVHLHAQDSIRWVEGRSIGLQGQAGKHLDREHFYDRLPGHLRDTLREDVWRLSQHAAGLMLHFYSNTQELRVRQKNRFNTHLPHMTGTGARGADLYVRQPGQKKWKWAGVSRPSEDLWQGIMISKMTSKKREYLLYLPPYDGIDSLWIGIDRQASLTGYKAGSEKKAPVVFYGTSIIQGCSASRPGMVPTNLISRRLNRPVINLGFSGNGTLDLPIADFLSQNDLSCLVLDCTPNLPPEKIYKRTLEFVATIKSEKPDLPVVLTGNAGHQDRWLNQKHQKTYQAKNRQTKKAYHHLEQQGYTHLHFIHGKRLLGEDNEATVDGIHYTDIGFQRYANTLVPLLEKILD